jgi:hypothetical protein
MTAAASTSAPRPGRLRRALGWLGLGLASAAVAAQTQPQQQVPQHWVSYATRASGQLQSSLSNPDDDTVVRLHSAMQSRMRDEGRAVPPAPFVVRVWVGPTGRIDRVAFDPLGDVQADADLRAVLTAKPLAEPPPRDMRQPMVLQLTLRLVSHT